MTRLEPTGNEKQEAQLRGGWQLFRHQIFSAPVADAVITSPAVTGKEAVKLPPGVKIVRYFAAFILCGTGVFFIGIVFQGCFHTFWECFLIESLGLTLFYYGQKLGWLTYDPLIETRGDRQREARIKARVAAIQRTRAEREAAEGRYYRR